MLAKAEFCLRDDVEGADMVAERDDIVGPRAHGTCELGRRRKVALGQGDLCTDQSSSPFTERRKGCDIGH